MRNFRKEKHNPVELIEQLWPGASTAHITYDPDMKKGQYDIVRQSGGDGTLLFTLEMFKKGLRDIVQGLSFYKPSEPKDWSEIKEIKYIIGPMRHVIVFGMIELACSKDKKYPGLRERIRMPVRCEYVYK